MLVVGKRFGRFQRGFRFVVASRFSEVFSDGLGRRARRGRISSERRVRGKIRRIDFFRVHLLCQRVVRFLRRRRGRRRIGFCFAQQLQLLAQRVPFLKIVHESELARRCLRKSYFRILSMLRILMGLFQLRDASPSISARFAQIASGILHLVVRQIERRLCQV